MVQINRDCLSRRMGRGLTVLCVLSLVGCAKGFTPTPEATCAAGAACANNGQGGTDTGGGDTNQPGPQPSKEWQQLQVDGKISDGPFKDTSAVSLDKVNKMLIVRLPLPVIGGLSGRIPIKEIPGAEITFETLAQGRTGVVLRLPLEKLLHGVAVGPESRLPNGDPLPGYPDGELPSLGLVLSPSKKLKGNLYLGPAAVGLFVNSPYEVGLDLTVDIKDGLRTVGYFALVAPKNGHQGGFYVSALLPPELARIIDENL